MSFLGQCLLRGDGATHVRRLPDFETPIYLLVLRERGNDPYKPSPVISCKGILSLPKNVSTGLVNSSPPSPSREVRVCLAAWNPNTRRSHEMVWDESLNGKEPWLQRLAINTN